MARWTVKADAEEESTGGGDFSPAPRSIYTIQVADYKDGMTEGGNGKPRRPKVTLTCEIADGEYAGKKVWHTVVQIPKGEKGHGFMVLSLHAFGLPFDGDLDFDTDAFQGRKARALLGIRPYTKKGKDGKEYTNDTNFIEELYTDNHPEPETLPPPKVQKRAAPKASRPEPQEELEEVPF